MLLHALKQKSSIELMIGDMGQVTTPEALRQLLKIQNRWPSKISIRFVRNSRFHLKTYLFVTGSRLHAIIGSGNLTGPGLTGDGEQALLISVLKNSTIAQQIMAPFEDFWADEGVSEDLSASVIEEYSKDWKPKFNPEGHAINKSIKQYKERKENGTKKPRCHYFYVPSKMTPGENRTIGKKTGWTERSFNWLGWDNKKKKIARRDLMVIDDGESLYTGRLYAWHKEIAGLELVIAYRCRNNGIAPKEVSSKLRSMNFDFTLDRQRSKGILNQKMFGAIEQIIKNSR